MSIVNSPPIQVFRQPLDTAGSIMLEQQIGVFMLWRFEDGNGNAQLDGQVSATFGGQYIGSAIPFTYNTKMEFAAPVTRVKVEWASQPGKVAVMVIAGNARAFDGSNIPAKQLVFPGQASYFGSYRQAVTTSLSNLVGTSLLRSRVVLRADTGNPGIVYFQNAYSTTLTDFMPLEPGQSFELRTSAQINAQCDAGTCYVRVYVEQI